MNAHCTSRFLECELQFLDHLCEWHKCKMSSSFDFKRELSLLFLCETSFLTRNYRTLFCYIPLEYARVFVGENNISARSWHFSSYSTNFSFFHTSFLLFLFVSKILIKMVRHLLHLRCQSLRWYLLRLLFSLTYPHLKRGVDCHHSLLQSYLLQKMT